MKTTFSRVPRRCLFPATALFLMAAVSCGDDSPKPASKNNWSKENILVYHWKAGPGDLHPTNGSSNARRQIIDLTHRFILGTDIEHNTLRPDLVKSLPAVSADGLRFTFELRDSITWDDGSPLRMEDILFSYKVNVCQLVDNPQAKPYFEFLKAVIPDPANPMQFTTVMSGPYIQNTAYLTDMAILQRTFFDPKNALGNYTLEQLTNPAFEKQKHPDLEQWAQEFNDPKYGADIVLLQGLGPYKITAWEAHQRIELTRKKAPVLQPGTPNSIYEHSYPEKIILLEVNDDVNIMLGIKSQNIDASTWISTAKLMELQQDSTFNANYVSGYTDNYDYQYIGLNLKPGASSHKPFFTDKNVRRAMALLTPLDDMINIHIKGKAKRVYSYISPLKAECSKDLSPIQFDMEQAKKLLDEAGWKDTDGDNIRDKVIDGKKTAFEFELLIAGNSSLPEKISKDMAASMYKAGIKMNYRVLASITVTEKITAHDFDAYMSAWVGSFYPDDPKQIWHSSNWENHGSNFVGFGTPASDLLIDSIRVTLDDTKRHAMENRLQHLIYEEQPYIFMYAIQRKVVAHRRFEHTGFYNEKPCMQLSNFRLQPTGN